MGVRTDGARRRIHMAGLVLVLMGLAAAIPMGITLADPPDPDAGLLASASESDLVANQPGGTLAVTAHRAGEPVALEADVHAWNGTLVETVPVENGTARLQMPASFARVTLRAPDGQWDRDVYAPVGKTAHLELDTATAAPGPEWVSMDLRPLVRVTAAVGLLGGLLVVAAGVATLRMRWFPVAVTGAALALAGSLLLAVAVPVLLLNVLLSLVALVFIVRGRGGFVRG